MPLYLTESDVEGLLGPGDAVEIVASVLESGSAGATARAELSIEGEALIVLAGEGTEVAGVSVALGSPASLVIVAGVDPPRVMAILEARKLRALRVAATSAVAARQLARAGARSVGVIGCGPVGAAHVECLRAALPGIETVGIYCRDDGRRRRAAKRLGVDEVEYGKEAGECDIVVTATTSRDPVLRGDWLLSGALVCAAGATTIAARELDNGVLDRAAFVCCDSLEQARLAAGDLVEPVERGVLDWLEVHELAETLVSAHPARQGDDDIVVVKSVGTVRLDLALAAAVLERARA